MAIINAAAQQQPAKPAAKGANPQQAAYDNVAVAALKIIFDVHRFPMILARIGKGAQDPVGTIGQMAAMIMQSIQATAQQQGKVAPPNILAAVLKEIVSNLLEIAVGAGVVDKKDVPQLMLAIGKKAMQVNAQTQQQAGPAQPAQPQPPQAAPAPAAAAPQPQPMGA